ncbi:MAG: DUF938 domain-containing protein [Pseudomonadota bacterium]
MDAADARRHSPAAERNRGAILAELLRLLPARGTTLEIASGTGQHAAHFAAALPAWRWQPSDGDARSLASIKAWCAQLPNVLPPLHLDVLAEAWPGVATSVDAIFCANLLHISPWASCAALMRGAQRHLAPSGLLLLYGPYIVDHEATAPSNLAFDDDLRGRNPAWGLRRLTDVVEQALSVGISLRERLAMPANNLLLVFEARSQTGARQPVK